MGIEYRENKDLVEKYRRLCFELGEDVNADNIQNSRSDLLKRIGELEFKWIHDRCM